jgi:hypothetical protein
MQSSAPESCQTQWVTSISLLRAHFHSHDLSLLPHEIACSKVFQKTIAPFLLLAAVIQFKENCGHFSSSLRGLVSMSASIVNSVALNERVPVQEHEDTLQQSNGDFPKVDEEASNAAMRIHQRYAEEREKRTRPDGLDQYIDPTLSGKFQHYIRDPWLDERSETVTLNDGDECKYLIVGAGFGGLLFACSLIKAGVDPEEIRIVEVAGGFGGTW